MVEYQISITVKNIEIFEYVKYYDINLKRIKLMWNKCKKDSWNFCMLCIHVTK